MNDLTPDKHVNAVIASHIARVEMGVAKYGQTLDANPAAICARLTHIQEEAMDAAAYCEWAKDAYRRELNKRATIEQLMLDCANGKRPMPDARTLRLWSLAIGTPRDQWSDAVRKAVQGEEAA